MSIDILSELIVSALKADQCSSVEIKQRTQLRLLHPHSTGRQFQYAHGDLGISLKFSKSQRKRRQPHDLGDLMLPVRFHYASTTLA